MFFTLHWTDKSCFEKGARYDHDFITEKNASRLGSLWLKYYGNMSDTII